MYKKVVFTDWWETRVVQNWVFSAFYTFLLFHNDIVDDDAYGDDNDDDVDVDDEDEECDDDERSSLRTGLALGAKTTHSV